MEVVITDWALDSYLQLIAREAFTRQEYESEIRPDVLRLKTYPADPKFQVAKFWSPAQDSGGRVVTDGWKMKWHNMGHGTVQLRLPVALIGGAILCQAYVKESPRQEKRHLAKFKTHLQLIRRGCYTVRGKLP